MELERLIETERRNDALIERAGSEAAGMVAAAKDLVAAHEAALASAVAEAIREQQRTVADEQAKRIARIRADADLERHRFDAVTDAQIASMVPDLLGVLLAEGGGE